MHCRWLIIGVVGACAAAVLAQDQAPPMSLHQAELMAHRDDPVNPDLIDGPVVVPQGRAAAPRPCRTIFGYLPYWESASNIQWDKITHLGAFSIEINSQGAVTNVHGWPWTSTVTTAHAHGVKVHLVVTLFNDASITTLINNATYKANFFNNMKNLMLAGNADGINIDFEPGAGDGDWQPQMDEFMGELSAYMDANIPGSETSIATAPINWEGWQFGNLVQNCDIIFIMGYAFYGSWSTTSGPCAPLTGGGNNLTSCVVTQYASARAVAPEKIVLGIPYYGGHWTTTTNAAYSPKIAWIGATFYENDGPQSLVYGVQWDASSQTPWYRYQQSGVWHQIWFDNADSLRLKYQLAEDYNLGGVGMWALNYDGTRPELWTVLKEEFVDPCCAEQPLDDIIFADAFDDGNAADRWSIAASSADYTADFDYDYSAAGIASAPNSAGSTRGLKFTVNSTDETPSTVGVSVFPQGVYVIGDYALMFDAWLNYNGGAGGGVGSTKFLLTGVGHAGALPSWPLGVGSDGKWFAVSAEGASNQDYRAFSGTNRYLVSHGVYAAGSMDSTAGYYQTLFPAPTYESGGAPGKHWVEVEVRKTGTQVIWRMNGTIVATSPASDVSGNVMVGMADVLSTLAVPLEESFLIIDNVRVEQIGDADCNQNGVADGCDQVGGGDYDADGDVDLADLVALADCLDGVNGTPRPTLVHCAAMCQQSFDADGDYDVDLQDYHAFQLSFGQ